MRLQTNPLRSPERRMCIVDEGRDSYLSCQVINTRGRSLKRPSHCVLAKDPDAHNSHLRAASRTIGREFYLRIGHAGQEPRIAHLLHASRPPFRARFRSPLSSPTPPSRMPMPPHHWLIPSCAVISGAPPLLRGFPSKTCEKPAFFPNTNACTKEYCRKELLLLLLLPLHAIFPE